MNDRMRDPSAKQVHHLKLRQRQRCRRLAGRLTCCPLLLVRFKLADTLTHVMVKQQTPSEASLRAGEILMHIDGICLASFKVHALLCSFQISSSLLSRVCGRICCKEHFHTRTWQTLLATHDFEPYFLTSNFRLDRAHPKSVELFLDRKGPKLR